MRWTREKLRLVLSAVNTWWANEDNLKHTEKFAISMEKLRDELIAEYKLRYGREEYLADFEKH